jgi:hypothetical protein
VKLITLAFIAFFSLAVKAETLDPVVQEAADDLQGGAASTVSQLSSEAPIVQAVGSSGSDGQTVTNQFTQGVSSAQAATAAAGEAQEYENDLKWLEACAANATSEAAQNACGQTYQNALNQNPALQQFANTVQQAALVDAVKAKDPGAVTALEQQAASNSQAYQTLEKDLTAEAATGTVSASTVATQQAQLNEELNSAQQNVETQFQQLSNSVLPQQ